MKSSPLCLTIIAACALVNPSAAQDPPKPKDVEQLQREVRALEERLRLLSQAASEVAELTMRSAAIWSRALGGDAKPLDDVKAKPRPAAAAATRAARPAAPAPVE